MKCPTCDNEEDVNTFLDIDGNPTMGYCGRCGRIFNKEEEEKNDV